MKKFSTLLALAGFITPAFAAVDSFSFDFSSGAPTDGVTVVNTAELTPNPNYYTQRNFTFQSGWYNQAVIADNGTVKEGVNCFVTLSRFAEDAVPDARLLMPELHVGEGTWLSWTAKSISYNAPEKYSVCIRTTDSDEFTPLAQIEKEEYFFHTHAISLAEYAGKDVQIAFVKDNNQGYMLALKSVQAGTPAWGEVATNTGHRFFGRDDEKILNFTITNFGGNGSSELAALKVVDSKNPENILGNVAVESPLEINDPRKFSIDFDLEEGTTLKYNLIAVYADGKESQLLEDYINVARFRRLALIEKLTGTWCTACPNVNYVSHYYQHLLGKDAVYLETHSSHGSSDLNGYDDYYMPILYCLGGDIPALTINRGEAQNSIKPQDHTIYEAAMQSTCTAQVTPEIISYDGENLKVKATFISSETIDNSDDSRRAVFVISEGLVPLNPDYNPQTSRGVGTSMYYGEDNFLPSPYPKEITVFHDLTRYSSQGGASGIPSSLPQIIEAETPYVVEWECEIPQTVLNPEDLRLTVEMVKFTTNKGTAPATVYNAAVLPLVKTNESGIGTVEATDTNLFTVYNVQGICIQRNVRYDELQALPSGLYIINGKKTMIR
ncbi:MAG: hypothetical protein NC328_03765 [Muribaculum sp.]|nr:hypothetical protein [Muribaculum sp.]